jgi:UDP-glucuronate 4-epimerase
MKAFITGCAGFIGSHLAESLLEDGHTVVGVDAFTDNYDLQRKLDNLEHLRSWGAFNCFPLDVTRGLGELVDGCDVIFHLAAEPGVRSSWGTRFDDYVRNNIVATKAVLQAARAQGEMRVVYASSSSIYGQAERLPTPEHALPAPFSPYGMTKLAAEHLCGLYHRNFGLDVVALRYFSVYGPRQRPDMAFNIFCRQILRGEPIVLYGGAQTRDFTYVGDIVRATRAAAESEAAGGLAVNIGGGSRISLDHAIEVLREVTGCPVPVRRAKEQDGDVRDTGADITLSAAVLGFRPSVGIREGLAAEWEWMAAEPFTREHEALAA